MTEGRKKNTHTLTINERESKAKWNRRYTVSCRSCNYFINFYVVVCTCMSMSVCVCMPTVFDYIWKRPIIWSLLLPTHMYTYVLNAIEIGNVRANEQASKQKMKRHKWLYTSYITHRKQFSILSRVFSKSNMSFFKRTVILCAISICNQMEMYCRIRAQIHKHLKNDKKYTLTHIYKK